MKKGKKQGKSPPKVEVEDKSRNNSQLTALKTPSVEKSPLNIV
jgi:hypothetical protein